jgi:hypothetical protein
MMHFVVVGAAGLVLLAVGLHSRRPLEVVVATCVSLISAAFGSVFAAVLVRRVVVEDDTVSFTTYLGRSWAGRASDLVALCPGGLTFYSHGIAASTRVVTPMGDHFLLTDRLDRYADVVAHLRGAAPNVPTVCPPPPWWQRLARAR